MGVHDGHRERMKKKKGRDMNMQKRRRKEIRKVERRRREGRKIGIQTEMDDENDLSCGQT